MTTARSYHYSTKVIPQRHWEPIFSTLRKHHLRNCVFSLYYLYIEFARLFILHSVLSIDSFIHSFSRSFIASILWVFTVFALLYCTLYLSNIYLLFWIHNSGKHPNLSTHTITITEWYHSFDVQINHTLMQNEYPTAVGRAEK